MAHLINGTFPLAPVEEHILYPNQEYECVKIQGLLSWQ